MEASLNELSRKKPSNHQEKDLDSVQECEDYLSKAIKVETKVLNKTTEFNVVLDRSPHSNYLDVKVG